MNAAAGCLVLATQCNLFRYHIYYRSPVESRARMHLIASKEYLVI